jgi:oxygen-dependent protoporphyrinogen oxidase
MSQLVDAVHRTPAGCVRLETKVQGFPGWGRASGKSRRRPGWKLRCADPSLPAAKNGCSARRPAGDAAGKDHLASCSVVVLGYRRSQIKHPLNAFGFVVPAIEKRRVIAGSFASVKFPGRAPDDRVIRASSAGAAGLGLPDDELVGIAREELGELLGAAW